MMRHHPVLGLSQNTKHESGRKVQSGNINAAKTIADIIKTCLGPKSMMKMFLNPMGGVMTINDGNAIIAGGWIQVQPPATKSMNEISRTQDEEVGGGTTTVIILAGEMLSMAEHFLEQQMHPTVVISAYQKALDDDMISTLKKISIPVDINNRDMMLNIINSSITTKVISWWSSLACNIALVAVKTVQFEENGQKEIDNKKYARVEKIPGEEDFTRILQMEEEYIQQLCEDIIQLKPDVVITEKCISDLAQHYLMQANITAIHKVQKTDNNHIARTCGARRVSGPEELREDDVETGAGLLEIKKIGGEYFTFITECRDPKALERNLLNAMQVCHNVLLDPQLVPEGGASEMAVAHELPEKSKAMADVEQRPYRAVAQALEFIPHTLIQNCGPSTPRRTKTWGVSSETGTLVDMKELGRWEPLALKLQTYKTAVEMALLLLRIDDVFSGHKMRGVDQSQQGGAPDAVQE
uniref:T-complex protein 1 subunit gamma n=1 Tax=Sciurus vulgaris TaxID=55149 RepID=A0A8D2JMU3_SCIVU